MIAPLAETYDVALLDLDGVVYIGAKPVPGAPEALAKARAAGMRLAYVTNNASRTPGAVAALLTSMGVPAETDDVVTSPQAAARLLGERLPAGAPVLAIGGNGLRLALRLAGFRLVSSHRDRPAAVVQGYSPLLSYDQLAEGGQAVAAGALYVATNADSTIPGGDGPPRPGNGALLQVIIWATGVQPIVTGKPERPLHHEAMVRTGARRPLVVGDRLDTDIEGAVNGGADSLLVLTGVTTPRQLLDAPERHRPTYVAADLTGLLSPYPQPNIGSGSATCGGYTARRDGDTLEVSGDGDPIDGLRALCAVAWQGTFDGGSADAALAGIGLR